jgi:hypothetical protein
MAESVYYMLPRKAQRFPDVETAVREYLAGIDHDRWDRVIAAQDLRIWGYRGTTREGAVDIDLREWLWERKPEDLGATRIPDFVWEWARAGR